MPSPDKQSIVHIIYIPFTGIGIGDYFRTNEWLKYRIETFKNYTLKSLINQKEKAFMVWLSFRPGDQENLDVLQLFFHLKESKIAYAATFDGLMYHDDKFGYEPIKLLKNVARIFRGFYRLGGWSNLLPTLGQLLKNPNRTLGARLKKSLWTLRKHIPEVDWVYLTRLDSDDMLHEQAVAEIQKNPPDWRRAYTMRNGYIHNKETGEVALYLPRHNPPFHTICFHHTIFFDPYAHEHYYENFKSHEDIPNIFQAVRLPDGLYMVLIHSLQNQISTIWNHPFRGNSADKEVLKNFGQ